MKKILVLITTSFILSFSFSGCGTFPTSYDHIEDNKVRVIDFTFEPCEAAPGDTVKMTALFAGRNVSMEDIDWTVAWKMAQNGYGVTEPLDPQDIDYIEPPQQKKISDQMSAITFSFKVPEDIMVKSPMIPDDWTSQFPEAVRNNIPQYYKSMSKSELLNNFDVMINMLKSGAISTDSQMISALPLLSQFLTVKFRVTANIKTAGFKVIRDYSVRYNSKLCEIPGVHVLKNNNPVIDSIGIFKVHVSNLSKFDTSKYKGEFTRLYGPQDIGLLRDSITPVVIDTGYSYYLFSYVRSEDSAWTVQSLLLNESVPRVEQFSSIWFYEMDDNEISGVNPNDLMFLGGGDGKRILPPLNAKVEHFTVWCKIKDQLIDEVNRPLGTAVIEGHGQFVYSQGYLNSIKSK